MTGRVKVCQDIHRLQGVYGVLGFFYEPSLSFCDVRWNAAMACLYHCISTRNKCKIQIESCCLNLNAQNQVSQLSYSIYIHGKSYSAWTHWQTYIVARILEPFSYWGNIDVLLWSYLRQFTFGITSYKSYKATTCHLEIGAVCAHWR